MALNPGSPRSRTYSVPAPVGGWNARDSLASMSEEDAVSMDNWWPMTTDVVVRNGYTQFSTGITGQIESLMNYGGATGQKLFCAAGTSFYNITTGGVVGAAVVAGLSNARWDYINVSTTGGNYLYVANGTDSPQLYDGTTWQAVTGVSAPISITGVTTSLLKAPNLFKNRVWFLEKNSLRAWFLPLSSVGGAASSLDFSSIARLGGNLVAMGTWTIDAGYGVDDLAVFVTSQGEVIVYRGSDPAFAATWALAGLWQVGSPVANSGTNRCIMKYGGDLALLTLDGLFPLASYLQTDRLNPRVALTEKIYQATSNATTLYGSNFGWDIEYYAKANMLILNVPVAVGSAQVQYAMNTISKSWCSFSGITANCWGIFNDEPYFGANGFIGRFCNGQIDNVTNIQANCLQAFNEFKLPGLNKRWTMMQPILTTNGTPSLNVGLNIDFNQGDNTGTLAFTSPGFASWDSAKWDTGLWGGGLGVVEAWQGVQGIGKWAAIRLKSSTANIETHWAATTYVYEPGGIL